MKTKFAALSRFVGMVGVAILTSSAFAKPYSHTQPPAPVTTNSATLNGMAVANGSLSVAWFEWGTNGSFAHSTIPTNIGSGFGVVRVSASITGLEASKTYSCRLVVSNSAVPTFGLEQRFITGGKVVAWGITGRVAVPSYLRDVVSLSSFSDSFAGHSLALRTDATVVAFATGSGNSSGQATVPAGLSNVIAVAAGTSHSMALREDGTVVSWGNRTNVPLGLSNVIAIAAGGSSVALKANGTVVTWASGGNVLINTLSSLSNVVTISASLAGILALKADGSVTVSGAPSPFPYDLTNVTGVASGRQHHLELRTNGTITASGWFDSGSIIVPVGLSNVIAMAGGGSHDLVLKSDGTLVTWGKYYNSYFGSVNTYIPSGLGSNVALISCGSDYSFAIRPLVSEDYKPYAHTQSAAPVTTSSATINGMAVPNGSNTVAWFEWGTTTNYGNTSPPFSVGSGTSVVRVGAPLLGLGSNMDYYYRLVASNSVGVSVGFGSQLTTGRKVAIWGELVFAGTSRLPPSGIGSVVKIAGGHGHCLALKPDGRVLVWGGYESGVTNIPSSLTNAVEIAGGYAHSLAIQGDGSVVSWGSYFNGQLVGVPSGLSNIIAVAGGDSHSLALKHDGTVVAWGTNISGQAEVPAGLDNVVAAAAGADFSVALRADGTVIAWSNEVNGMTSVPVGLSNVVAISSSVWVTLALKSDGTVAAWGGEFSSGVLLVPAGLSNVVAIAVGLAHGMALKNDGSVTVWGDNTIGQGNIPPGLSNAVAISSGDYHCMSLGPNVPPQANDVVSATTPNSDLIIPLSVVDPNGDLLTFRIATLPTVGSLYQDTAGVRGNQVTVSGTPVSDSSGRVIFAPATDTLGAPYASFRFLANDGEVDSAPAAVTVNVITRPVIDNGNGGGSLTNGPFVLNFTGFSNVTYRVWASTNLSTWTVLGTATQPTPGMFIYSDLASTNLPRRFYRLTSP